MLRFALRASMFACLLIATSVAVGQNAGNGKQVAQAPQPAGGAASGAQPTAQPEGVAAGAAGAVAAAAAAVLAATSGGGSATTTHTAVTHTTSH